MKRINLYLVIIFVISGHSLISQSLSPFVLANSGENFISPAQGIQLSWTVGELITETFEGPSYVINQGFHQDTMFFLPVFINDMYDKVSVKIFPNPVKKTFTLFVDESMDEKFRVILIDLQGHILLDRSLVDQKTRFSLEGFETGTYVFSIYKGSVLFHSYKIIKSNH